MKKYIITVIFAIGFVMGLNAQSDGFFGAPSDKYTMYRENPQEFSNNEMPALFGHEYAVDQDADPAPLGTGLIVLSAMGLAYAIRRKDNE